MFTKKINNLRENKSYKKRNGNCRLKNETSEIEWKVSKCDEKSIKSIQSEKKEKRWKKENKPDGLWDNIQRFNMMYN